MKSFLLKTTGVFCVLLGIAGLFLPFLQGLLLIFLGLSLLSPELAVRVRREILLRWGSPAVVPFDEWRRFGAAAGCTTRKFPAQLGSTDDLDAKSARTALRALWPHGSKIAGPERFAYLKQVHGGRAVRVSAADFADGDFLRTPDADALVTAERRLALLVLSADCLPVFFLFRSSSAAQAVGLAHAGWKGTREHVAVRTLESLLKISDGKPQDVQVILGPSMDVRHYEVGEEFRGYFPESVKTYGGKCHFDLRAENARQLIEAGVPQTNIIDTGFSTAAHNRLFYSFRLEKEKAGRIVSYVYLV